MKQLIMIAGAVALASVALAFKPPTSTTFAGTTSFKSSDTGIHSISRVDLTPTVTVEGGAYRFVSVCVALDFHRYQLALFNALERRDVDSSEPISIGGSLFDLDDPLDRQIMGVTGIAADTLFLLTVQPKPPLTWGAVHNPNDDVSLVVTEKKRGG